MPKVEYTKATPKDLHDLVDFLDYVFSTAYNPNNFEAILPDFYTAKNFETGVNYIVKEDGKIVANVGAYPATYDVGGHKLKVAGITSVAVHRRTRSKGYMRKLMDTALKDMQNNGIELSFLIGQRQRYEYFGYTPCGIKLNYSCNKTNIRHYFNDTFKSDVTLKEIKPDNKDAFDEIYHMYNTKNIRIIRPRERFIDIMATWESKTIGIYLKDNLVGYLLASKDYTTICELNLCNPSLIAEVIGTYLNQYDRSDVAIDVYPPEVEHIKHISALAENVTAKHSLNFNVHDYPAVLGAFLKLKSKTATLPDGKLTVCIKDICNLTITVVDNQPSVSVTESAPMTSEKPDIECTHTEAMQLFFSPASAFVPVSAFSTVPMESNYFTRSLFPAPLFVRANDQS